MSMKFDNHLELLRSSIMDNNGVEEKVEVNQRHLIDKILARYSAEYVLYRELMQNADDASSSSVQIHFQSSSPDQTKPPNLLAKCNKIVFKNNGIAFRPEDWQRLKRIAEGNPDEQKIGAFGVGFYSLFSVCDNPFVFSGSQCMAFYFKGDQLFAKRADVPKENDDLWTSFLMDLREPMELPDFDHFCKFLTTSMGFTANLKQITVYFDNHQIFNIVKKVTEPRAMVIDTHKMLLTTPQRMFTITGSDMRQIQLDSEKYTPPSLFTPLTNFLSFSKLTESENKNGLPVEKASIFLRVVTGSLNVNVSRDYEKQMERATKKKPPKTTKFQLVYTGKEELDASENKSKIFKDLIPFPHQGRVFIGFPTHQTTGCCCHMASRFIPTVERESIDFADRYISIWNKELLAVGGLMARIVYNDEMGQISKLYRELVGYSSEVDKTKSDSDDSAKVILEKRAAHALHSFTFQHSTPSSIVGKVHEERFFNACKAPLDIITSHGIQPITITRCVPDKMSLAGHAITELLDRFIKTIPTITPIVFQECKESVTKLANFDLLHSLGINDVLKELNMRSLKEDEMVACMQWWIECNKKNPSIPKSTLDSINDLIRTQFLDAAIMDCGEERGLLQLSHTRWWLNPKVIPLDMPVPEDTMPFSISKNFLNSDLAQYFGNMNELGIVPWVQFIVNKKPELETSREFTERVLNIVSRQYMHISAKLQEEVVTLLKLKKCIPTKFGMKQPYEAYFPNVNLFDDLPIYVFNQSRNINESFLTALGVRKHVELQMVFDRLISDGSWSHVELIKYLTSVQSTLSETEIRRLRGTPIFIKEGEKPRLKEIETPINKLDENGKPIMEKKIKKVYKRYKASDLFAPTDIVQDLKLPVLYWPNNPRWRPTSDEAKFLEKLGLITIPPLITLLTLASPEGEMSTDRKQIQKRALSYLIEHHQDYKNEYDVNKIQIKFLPCLDGKTFATPQDCFTNPDVQLLDFQVLHRDLIPVRDKLGVRENPSADRLIQTFLNKQEQDREKVRKIFEYMASRMGNFSSYHWHQLRQSAFIPVEIEKNGAKTVKLMEPSKCYFETEDSTSFHKELFLYVNFGKLANSFLRSCGVKDEPTTVELAAMIVKNPQRFWDLSGGGERYLNVLRQIAGQFYLIRSNKQLINDMKTKPFLVGIKRTTLSEQNKKAQDDNEEDEGFIQYRLAKASDIFIIDDTTSHQIFSPLSAPMEPLLEDLYSNLGSQRLSTQIKEAYSYVSSMGVTFKSKEITKMIFERTPIIIYQMINDDPQRRKELLHDEKYVKQHLKVMQVKDLKINRTFKYTDEKNIQPTTSCADRVNFGIYISDTNDIDYYDVANSLCSLLFARVRFNDAIIVERYLTTSLYNLRRKGVPVDRILNIRKQQTTPPVSNTSISKPHPQMPKPLTSDEMDLYTKKVQEVFSDCQESYIRQILAQQYEDHVQNTITKLLHEDYPRVNKKSDDGNKIISSVISEEEEAQKRKQADIAVQQRQQQTKAEKSTGFINKLWSTWKQQVTPLSPVADKASIPSSLTETINQTDKNTIDSKPKLPKSETTITPNFTANIKQNLKRAVHSCKPYTGQDVYTPPRINQVRESTSYCDAAPGNNLTYVGNVKGMEFYVHRSVQPDDVLNQYGQAMARFTNILDDLAKVFQLKLATIQIFYDTEGPTIAFNLSGSLFMNLRYYLALHDSGDSTDQATIGKKCKEALIYWFMTLCHELAHNFVSEHSSEHEFYMSSFAENYLEILIDHIYSSSIGNNAEGSTMIDHSATSSTDLLS
ncbi:uncharacterized protein BX663DRAFT_579996 [Cokeromyces recurvatus]|uniref:uncharacterized protein n=1 Tax=Cokeromyces recurvatus TaxID=90255 RepID=UPI00221E55F2|nr:uncharacterized protein BX663DRAFT_579996 [Cokeromyces recurvatus]KAI7898765.1 hypothetical protein BX663DRAFT_579996 [Cokeromyces recurvatus]